MTGQEEEKKEEEVAQESYISIMKLNKPEMIYNIFGVLFAIIAGAVQPGFGIAFAEILNVFGKYACAYDQDIEKFVKENRDVSAWSEHVAKYDSEDACSEEAMAESVVWWSLGFVSIGVVSFIGFSMISWCFSTAGENLTLRLRRESFKKYMQLEMGYFDEPANSTGALTARLSIDASKVQGAIGGQFGAICKGAGAMGVALFIGFYYEWRVTLISFAFCIVLGGLQGFMYKVILGDTADKVRAEFEEAGQCTSEATMNIRTVASLGREDFFVEKYKTKLNGPLKNHSTKAYIYGFTYGAANSMEFFMYAGCFYYAAWLIEVGALGSGKFSDIFKVLMSLVFGAITAGEAGAMVPDIAEARTAASRIIQLLNKPSKIDPFNDGGKKPGFCKGKIVFKDVHYNYATRPDIPVLKGLTLTVEPNETVALVGQSGCGKSTTIQLIERFYDGTGGSIELDGVPINQLNVQWLRNQMGFVQQEPVLFNRSIKDNILFGTDTINSTATKANQVRE